MRRTIQVLLLTIYLGIAAIGPTDLVRAIEPPCVAGVKNLFRNLCAETIVPADPAMEVLPAQGMASISGIAFGADGSLYFARPATREIWRLRPDGKGNFVAPQLFAGKLEEPPNGLAYDPASDAFFVSADTLILRLRDTKKTGEADEKAVIVSGLPGHAGRWLGNIRVGRDRRLYVAKGSSCEACAETDPRRAALLSFALDGSDMQIVARGLRDSYDFDWEPTTNTLYIVDNERSGLPAEVNAVTRAGLDFGWPYCDSNGKPMATVEGATVQRCTQTVPPVLRFDAGSHPTGAMFYRGAAFPAYQNGLLIALSGTWNTPQLAGFELQFVPFENGQPGTPRRILPETPRNTADASLGHTSFYPYHLSAIAIDAQGWIYTSVSEGRIYRFRPRE